VFGHPLPSPRRDPRGARNPGLRPGLASLPHLAKFRWPVAICRWRRARGIRAPAGQVAAGAVVTGGRYLSHSPVKQQSLRSFSNVLSPACVRHLANPCFLAGSAGPPASLYHLSAIASDFPRILRSNGLTLSSAVSEAILGRHPTAFPPILAPNFSRDDLHLNRPGAGSYTHDIASIIGRWSGRIPRAHAELDSPTRHAESSAALLKGRSGPAGHVIQLVALHVRCKFHHLASGRSRKSNRICILDLRRPRTECHAFQF